MYKTRKIKYIPWVGDPADLVTMAVARRICGLTLPGLIRAIERGVLTEVINDKAKYHGRRMVIREEVEHYNE